MESSAFAGDLARAGLRAGNESRSDVAEAALDDGVERPVFYSDRKSRPRVARAAGWALAAAAMLWVAAILASALGVRPLGELGLPLVPSHVSGQRGDSAAPVSSQGTAGAAARDARR